MRSNYDTLSPEGQTLIPLTLEQTEIILSQTIMELYAIKAGGRVRNPEGDRIRIERYELLIKSCLDYQFYLVFKGLHDLREELNSMVAEKEK